VLPIRIAEDNGGLQGGGNFLVWCFYLFGESFCLVASFSLADASFYCMVFPFAVTFSFMEAFYDSFFFSFIVVVIAVVFPISSSISLLLPALA